MTAPRIAVHPDGPIKVNPDSPMKGMRFPYVTKHGFPVFFFEGDEIESSDVAYEYVAIPPGMIGCNLRGDVYVIDADGDAASLGLVLPARLDPQPLEVDEEHPFFAAARRAIEEATTT
jgi:hypothetical protein